MGKSSFGFPSLKKASHSSIATNKIDSNIKAIKPRYGLSNGYIATKSLHNKHSKMREYYCEDPVESAKRLFMSLGRGGIQKVLDKHEGKTKGWLRIMKDGSVITYRPNQSSDGSAVVEIQNSVANTIKKYIFIKRRKKRNERSNQ